MKHPDIDRASLLTELLLYKHYDGSGYKVITSYEEFHTAVADTDDYSWDR